MSRCCLAKSRVLSAGADEGEAVPLEGLVKGRGVEARSGRRWDALFKLIFSRPRSWRRESIMAAMSEEERRGCPQNVQGPMPSFTQIILPQFKQLAAAARRGWRVARQVQRRDEGSAESEGFVCISRVRMAESY